jgi:4-carboxymuconolactone decarboxylase
MQRPSQPRIAPVDPASLTESQRTLAGVGASNVILTLVRHPDLFTAWITLGETLLFSARLSPRDRELIVLRVALRANSPYEWANHVLGALAAGATPAEIHALSDPSATWADADAALLRAVDELCSDDGVSDETWAALAASRDDVQLIEILALIGYYRMNAGLLNSIGVQPEPGRPRFGEVPAPTVVSPRPSPPPRPSATGDSPPNHPRLDGTWQIVFHHPSGDQELTLVLETRNGATSGSVFNPALKITVPIVEGTVDDARFEFRAPMKMPMPVEIGFTGTVDGDAISGSVTIQGGGTFPFEGTRVEGTRATGPTT